MENTFIVKIIAKNANGSGFIFKSEINDEAIVITCAHCIEGTDVKDIEVEYNGESYCAKARFVDEKTDIAAILISGSFDVKKVFLKNSSNSDINNELYIEGYPRVANMDRSCSKRLSCSLRPLTMSSQEPLILKLNEKINDTSSSSEKEKLAGFSGSPVFLNGVSGEVIVGMLNEIESDNGQDVNYNDVKAIRIEDILHNLHKLGVILYYLAPNGDLNIKWVNKHQLCGYSSKKVLVIGGSGAGKSSFIKTFALNSNLIDSSGDGQTTRTDIEYKFSISNEKPKITVTLLNKENFINKMMKQIEIPLLSFCFWLLLNEKYKIDSNIDIAIKSRLRKLNECSYANTKIATLINTWYELNEKNNDDKRKKLIDLNYDFISVLLDNENGLCSVNLDVTLADMGKNDLKKILLTCKGFFSHEEFNFLDGENSQAIESIFDKIFENITIKKFIESIIDSEENIKNENNMVGMFFSKIYEKLQPQIFEYYQCKSNTFSLDLLESNKLKSQSIGYLLKVIDKSSLTSMLSKVVIEDMFNNRYSWIMANLKIKEIWLIDTCGLDHVEKGETPVEIIKEAFSKRNDDIKTVFYIKKLDSGRPTELEQIIPAIYKAQSNAAVYCILNGADILYGMHKAQDIISFDDVLKCPNSIKYLLSEEGKTDIMQSIKEKTLINGHGIGEGRCKILCSVLTKNLIPYCSRIENKTFDFNNEHYIKRLFNSIAVEEHLGLDFITEEVIKFVENSEFDVELKECLAEVFRRASIINWTSSTSGHGHWALKKANIDRIEKYELGYYRSYDDRWSMHFKDAYQSVFSVFENNIGIVDKLFGQQLNIKNCYDKLESILIDFKDDFFGCPQNEIYKIVPTTNNEIDCAGCSQKCFRKLLIKMYDSNSYQYSLKYDGKISRETWLNEICNFSKGFATISNDLIPLFKSKLLHKMKNENTKNLSLILRINPEIEKDYKKLKEKIVASFLGVNEDDSVLCKKALDYMEKNVQIATFSVVSLDTS